MRLQLSRYLLLLILIISLPVCAALGGDRTSKDVGGDFILVDHNGQPFDLKQLRGKVVLLFFGYTTCPDVCHLELSDLAMIFNRMKDKAENVQGLFITVDPERDTLEILKEYVTFFSEKIIGLTGSVEAINRVASQYHITYRLNKQEGVNYSVDHSANLYVIRPDGKLHAVVPYGLPPHHVQKIVNSLIE